MTDPGPPPEGSASNDPKPGPPSPDLLVTGQLLERAKAGDGSALEVLMARYRPRLVRWATGRLPHYARSLHDTADLVQETLLCAIEGLDRVEESSPGQFQAYVRQAVLNRIRDQIRWASRRPRDGKALEHFRDPAPSPLERAIGRDMVERYERALEQLSDVERQLIHFRIELDFSYEEIAAAMDRGSQDAARMAVQRAIRKLAKAMGDAR